MEVTVEVGAGESLTLGIMTSGRKPDGTLATGSEATGWFKVDHFRIERIEDDATAIDHEPLNIEHETLAIDHSDVWYDLSGRKSLPQPLQRRGEGKIYVGKGRKHLFTN